MTLKVIFENFWKIIILPSRQLFHVMFDQFMVLIFWILIKSRGIFFNFLSFEGLNQMELRVWKYNSVSSINFGMWNLV